MVATSEYAILFHPDLHQFISQSCAFLLHPHACHDPKLSSCENNSTLVYIHHSDDTAWRYLTYIFPFFPLTAMSIYMLLVFEVETGIASVCVLSSGVLVLLLIVIHSSIRAAHTAKHFHNEQAHTMYHSNPENIAGIHTLNLSAAEKPRRQHSLANLHSHFINPAHMDPKPQYSASNGPRSDKDGYSSGGSRRTHRTLSTESGLFQAQTKPWNGVNSEMRSVLARKATIKDSTLV